MSGWTPFPRTCRSLWVERALVATLAMIIPGGVLALLWLVARRLKQHTAASQRDDSSAQ